MSYQVTCNYIDICYPDYLQDHHKGDSELLLAISVQDGMTTEELVNEALATINSFANDLPSEITDEQLREAITSELDTIVSTQFGLQLGMYKDTDGEEEESSEEFYLYAYLAWEKQEITVQDIARDYLTFFVIDTRENGDHFVKTNDSRPDELKDLIYSAHGDMLPDDWRYQFIWDVLGDIADSDDPDEPELESDIYNSDLLRWLSSRGDRYDYVDEAVKDYGLPTPLDFELMNIISLGQLREKEEVYYSVLQSLKNLADE